MTPDLPTLTRRLRDAIGWSALILTTAAALVLGAGIAWTIVEAVGRAVGW